jgi:hypothetical protein
MAALHMHALPVRQPERHTERAQRLCALGALCAWSCVRRPAALHAPSCVPFGDALECFVVAGLPSYLRLRARDAYGNDVRTGGREWYAALESLPPDASTWREVTPEPLVSDDADAPAGVYTIKLAPPHAGPLRLTMRPLVHGVPSSDAFVIGLLAAPSPADPLAFALTGGALRVTVAGEPATLLCRPRSFGDARALAARTFSGLRAWIALPGGGIDGGARMLPLRLSRRLTHVSGGGGDPFPDAPLAAHADGRDVARGVAAAKGERGACGDAVDSGLAAEGVPFALPTDAIGLDVPPDFAAGAHAHALPTGRGGQLGKRRVSAWHGSDGSWSLMCTADDLDDGA